MVCHHSFPIDDVLISGTTVDAVPINYILTFSNIIERRFAHQDKTFVGSTGRITRSNTVNHLGYSCGCTSVYAFSMFNRIIIRTHFT